MSALPPVLTERRVPLAGGDLCLRTQVAAGWTLDDLCGFASRQNPKRAFLFVSRVLGKHLPAKPSAMRATHDALAGQMREFLAHQPATLFLGFAETATGFGAGVFEACQRLTPNPDDLFVQTTRYFFDKPIALHFQEEHSHATGHLLYTPEVGQRTFFETKTLVLLDDELSTGQTNINFLRAFLTVNPHIRKVALVSLINWMSPARRQLTRDSFPGIEFKFCALMEGDFVFESRADFVCPAMPAVDGNRELKDDLVPHSFGRFGLQGTAQFEFEAVLARLALDKSRPVHVVGDGEYMYPAYRLAAYLEDAGYAAFVQSTTRSPILLGDAIGARAEFTDHYGDGMPNFIYNAPAANSQVLLCTESVGAAGHDLLRVMPAQVVFHKDLQCK